MHRLLPLLFLLVIVPAAHAADPAPCDTSTIKIMSGGYVPYAEPAVDIRQDGGEASYDAGTGTVLTKVTWPGMYSTRVDMREAYRLVGPASTEALPVTASLRLTGNSEGQCPPHPVGNCEPTYAGMSLYDGNAFLGGTNIVHGGYVGTTFDRSASFQVQVVPGTWVHLRLYVDTGVVGTNAVAIGQASFVLPDGYTLESCHGATFTPPPPGTVDVPAARLGELALRALGANPSSALPAFACDLPADGEANLALLDLRGRIVWHEDLGWRTAGPHRVDLAGADALPSGVYWARLTQAGARAQRKLVLVGR